MGIMAIAAINIHYADAHVKCTIFMAEAILTLIAIYRVTINVFLNVIVACHCIAINY